MSDAPRDKKADKPMSVALMVRILANLRKKVRRSANNTEYATATVAHEETAQAVDAVRRKLRSGVLGHD